MYLKKAAGRAILYFSSSPSNSAQYDFCIWHESKEFLKDDVKRSTFQLLLVYLSSSLDRQYCDTVCKEAVKTICHVFCTSRRFSIQTTGLSAFILKNDHLALKHDVKGLCINSIVCV